MCQHSKNVLVLALFFLSLFLLEPVIQTQDTEGLLAASEARTALVIGNAAYPTARLRNPLNDALGMKQVLEELGFTVLGGNDLARSFLRWQHGRRERFLSWEDRSDLCPVRCLLHCHRA